MQSLSAQPPDGQSDNLSREERAGQLQLTWPVVVRLVHGGAWMGSQQPAPDPIRAHSLQASAREGFPFVCAQPSREASQFGHVHKKDNSFPTFQLKRLT